jgi:hypothetical protein
LAAFNGVDNLTERSVEVIAVADSEAYERFQKSTKIGYDEWHDGTGYDLDAFAEMTAEEKDHVTEQLRAKGSLDWRDMEVLQLHGDRESFDKLRDVLATGSIDERAHALRLLIEMGRMPGNVPDVQLAHVLDDIDGIAGMTTALLIASQHAGAMSNAALLRGVRDRRGVAVNFAGMVCYLAGVTNEEFDWKLRPLFLRLGEGTPESDRNAAFAELCGLADVDPRQIPEQGRGAGVVFPKSKQERKS